MAREYVLASRHPSVPRREGTCSISPPDPQSDEWQTPADSPCACGAHRRINVSSSGMVCPTISPGGGSTVIGRVRTAPRTAALRTTSVPWIVARDVGSPLKSPRISLRDLRGPTSSSLEDARNGRPGICSNALKCRRHIHAGNALSLPIFESIGLRCGAFRDFHL